jgi:uncharacterized protein YccT (UPF0319 family)
MKLSHSLTSPRQQIQCNEILHETPLRVAPTLDLSAKSKTTTSTKMNIIISYNGTKSKTVNVVKSYLTMAGGAAAAQDSSQVFPMAILLSLAVLIRVRRSSLEEETRSCVLLLFLH